MVNITEPYVKIKEVVRQTPLLLNIDGSANIGGVVVSPIGARYQYISGPKDFLEKLVGADELPRNSHISLINAYYCSYFTGLVIARSLNTTNVGGYYLQPGAVTPSWTPAKFNGGYPDVTGYNRDLPAIFIYATDPSVNNIWKVSISLHDNTDDENESVNYNLEINALSGSPYEDLGTFVVSLDPYAKDDDGNNCYLGNLSDRFTGLNIELVNQIPDDASLITTDEPLTFGNSEVNLSQCAESAKLCEAIDLLADQTEYNIEYLSDFGITDTTFLDEYMLVGVNNYWFTPIDIPASYTNLTKIKEFSESIASKSGTENGVTCNTIIGGPFNINSAFLGWPTRIAWSSLYYERVFLNRAANSEYAPCFEQTNGILSYQKPTTMLSKSERESLLNGTSGPANFVVYDQALNAYYTNDNRLHTKTNNVMSEEMNRRMSNRISKDIKYLMVRYKGQLNTQETRDNVVSLLKYYFNSNIMTQYYRPDAFNIICDTTNNTPEVISSNQLALSVQIRLYGSIKFINIINEIFPIGVDFES